MFQNNERNPQVAPIYVGSQASGAAATVPGIYFRKRSRIKNVYLVDQLGFTGTTADYFTLTLQDNATTPVSYASGAVKAALAALTQTSLALASGGGTAFDAAPASGQTDYSNTLSSGGEDEDQVGGFETDVPAGTMLNVKIAGTASAAHLVLTNAIVLVEFYNL
jgi:hypothetical protein